MWGHQWQFRLKAKMKGMLNRGGGGGGGLFQEFGIEQFNPQEFGNRQLNIRNLGFNYVVMRKSSH